MIWTVAAFVAMLLVVILTSTKIKISAPFGLLLSSFAASLVAGVGIPLTRIVEGSFGFFYIVLTFGCGLILVKIMNEIGFNNSIKILLLRRLGNHRAILFLSLMGILMIPGMLTGMGAVAVISTGTVVASVLEGMKMNKKWIAVFISTGAILGMVAPPVNLPLMYMGVLIALPYDGYTWILLLMTIPLAIFFALWIGFTQTKETNIHIDEFFENQQNSISNHLDKFSVLYSCFPIIIVMVLLVCERMIPSWPALSLPLILCSGALFALPRLGAKKFFELSSEALRGQAFIILMILLTAGIKAEFLSLSGVRGLLATFFFAILPAWLLIPGLIGMPLLGAFGTVFGATFILGYPNILALLPRSSIICAAALSLIASVADIMPPTALSGNLAAHLVGEEKYRGIFVRMLIPASSMILLGIMAIVLADPLAAFLS